jgi:hypothetical protein
MALAFLLDENLRGPLWHGIQHHNAQGVDVLDVVCVGEQNAPPLGTLDPDLLLWSEANGRLLITRDSNSMPGHLADHLSAGHHSPGILMLRRRWTIPAVIGMLVLYDQTADPHSLVDRIDHIP